MVNSQDLSRDQQDFASVPKNQPNYISNPAASDTNSEDLAIGPRATYINSGAAAGLSQEHRDYLIKRHGTLELDPIPTDDPADPYNWPEWKKMANLVVVGFNAMMTTFTAASIIPAYENISVEFNCTVTQASYLTSIQILILGWAPLFWKPLSQRYGRRPIWLISMIGSMLFNIGCALSYTYSTMAICRAFGAFFICPAMAYGSAVVTETYFKRQRAQYMGVWTLLVTLGVHLPVQQKMRVADVYLQGHHQDRSSWASLLTIPGITGGFTGFLPSSMASSSLHSSSSGQRHGTSVVESHTEALRLPKSTFRVC